MIAYRTSRKALIALIETSANGWTERAAERTRVFKRQRGYHEKSSIWSEIKPVYMRLQGEAKCAFCERKLESERYGKIEQAVEHFRPKGKVTQWKLPVALKHENVFVAKVPKDNKGYYLRAYDIFNYTAACGPCNSALKGNYFPIGGKYDLPKGNPTIEKPYLIYPIGKEDEPPESLLEFYGTSPRPIAPSGRRRHRALVTIEFFSLDDPIGRKNLFRDRAVILMAMYPLLEKLATCSGNQKVKSNQLLNAFMSEKAPHSNCARSFVKLFDSNPREAKALCENATQLIISSS